MHRLVMTAALLSLLLTPLLAQAQVVELGNACWQLLPFTTDVLELSITQMPPVGVKSMFRVSGEWNSIAYQLPCGGAAFATGTGFILGVVCANNAGLFSGDGSITLNAVLNPSTNGTWELRGSNGFPNPGVPGQNLTRVTCGLPLPTPSMMDVAVAGGNPVP